MSTKFGSERIFEISQYLPKTLTKVYSHIFIAHCEQMKAERVVKKAVSSGEFYSEDLLVISHSIASTTHRHKIADIITNIMRQKTYDNKRRRATQSCDDNRWRHIIAVGCVGCWAVAGSVENDQSRVCKASRRWRKLTTLSSQCHDCCCCCWRQLGRSVGRSVCGAADWDWRQEKRLIRLDDGRTDGAASSFILAALSLSASRRDAEHRDTLDYRPTANAPWRRCSTCDALYAWNHGCNWVLDKRRRVISTTHTRCSSSSSNNDNDSSTL